jgi:hypothetical protein
MEAWLKHQNKAKGYDSCFIRNVCKVSALNFIDTIHVDRNFWEKIDK